MTRSLRALLGLAAVAAAASAAGTQPPQDSTQTRAGRAAATADSQTQSRRAKPARRYRSVSRGEVARSLVGNGLRAMPRDYYGADDPRCDDLCQHEKMMDARYGKDRERLPGARRGS
jgi:hypothetical protein